MTSFIIASVCALALSASPGQVQADTVDVYIIDNVKVENFDGSQLKGKSILDYSIKVSGTRRIHTIQTADGKFTISHQAFPVSEFSKLADENARIAKEAAENAQKAADQIREQFPNTSVIILDNKIIPIWETQDLDPDNISNILVYKPGSKEASRYGQTAAKKGVVIINTKGADSDFSVAYIVNGKKISKEEFSKINSSDIKEMSSVMNDSTLKLMYGADDVIFIKLKKAR